MQNILLIGNASGKPEERVNAKGQKFISFSLAVNGYSKDPRPPTWYQIVLNVDRVPPIISSIDKGSSLIVSGELSPPRAYTKKNGELGVSLYVRPNMIKFVPRGESNMLKKEEARPEEKGPYEEEDIPF